MIDRLLELYRHYVSRVVFVVGPSYVDEAKRRGATSELPIDVVIQQTPTGMLDAVLLAYDAVQKSVSARVWVTWCDQVAIHPRTVARLSELSTQHANAAMVMPVAFRKDPYIHLERNSEGRIISILHKREGDKMPDRGESDAGLFSFSREAFLSRLPEYAVALEKGTATSERNLLPFIPWINELYDVVVYPCVDDTESLGINTPEDLKAVAAYL